MVLVRSFDRASQTSQVVILLSTMTRSIFDKLDELTAQLSQVAPPPPKPQGLDLPPGSVGRWLVHHVAPGYYSLRAEYVTPIGRTVLAEPSNELVGNPQALLMALEFAVKLAKVSRYEWRAVE